MDKTLETVRERERERERERVNLRKTSILQKMQKQRQAKIVAIAGQSGERVILTKLCFVNHAKKSNGISVLKNNKYIKGREIGYVDRCKSYV